MDEKPIGKVLKKLIVTKKDNNYVVKDYGDFMLFGLKKKKVVK